MLLRISAAGEALTPLPTQRQPPRRRPNPAALPRTGAEFQPQVPLIRRPKPAVAEGASILMSAACPGPGPADKAGLNTPGDAARAERWQWRKHMISGGKRIRGTAGVGTRMHLSD